MTSREIREYDQAVRKLKGAQCTLADLGARFLALGENEPTIRMLAALCGFDIVIAGYELINLSQVYVTARSASELRRKVEKALDAINAALAMSRHQSHNELTKIRLEPMRLRKRDSKQAAWNPF